MIRYFISAIITLIAMALISLNVADKQQASGTFFVGMVAFFVIAAMSIYDINSWSLRKRTIVHFVVMLVTVLPTLYLSGWYDVSSWQGIGLMLLSYGGFGLVAWTIGFTTYKVATRRC